MTRSAAPEACASTTAERSASCPWGACRRRDAAELAAVEPVRDDGDRAAGVVDHAVGGAADDRPPDRAARRRAEHTQAGVRFFECVGQRVRGVVRLERQQLRRNVGFVREPRPHAFELSPASR